MSESLSSNPYAAPESGLQSPQVNSGALSIEQALSRGYDYKIGNLLSEAWQLVSGTKGIIFGGFLVFYAVMMVASLVIGAIVGLLGFAGTSITTLVIGQFVVSILAAAVAYPFMAGIGMIGIRRAAGQPIAFSEIFGYFNRTGALVITAIAMMLLIYVGFFLLLIPGIYLSVAYMLAIPLVVERGLSPWQAMEASRKAISQHWFKAFGLFLVLGLIISVSAIPLGIGLIWTIPLLIITIGVLYRTIFGVLPVSR